MRGAGRLGGMKIASIALLFLLACVGCDKMVPEKKDPLKEELVTPEEKKAIEEFGDRVPQA